jgi:hypothetical protein
MSVPVGTAGARGRRASEERASHEIYEMRRVGRREAYAIGACPMIGHKTVSVKSCGNTDRSCASAALTGPLPRSLRDVIDMSCATAAPLLPREHLNLANPSDSARRIRSTTCVFDCFSGRWLVCVINTSLNYRCSFLLR